jgi:redox-sensitive bicupin YhaK (pirin superfamily)
VFVDLPRPESPARARYLLACLCTPRNSHGVRFMNKPRGNHHCPPNTQPKPTRINLPKRDKMCKPRYQDYQPDQIPTVEDGRGAKVRVMAGGGALGQKVEGPIKMRNPGMLLDVSLAPGASFTQVGRRLRGTVCFVSGWFEAGRFRLWSVLCVLCRASTHHGSDVSVKQRTDRPTDLTTDGQAVPADWTAFAYIHGGAGAISGRAVQREQAVVLGPGDHFTAEGG